MELSGGLILFSHLAQSDGQLKMRRSIVRHGVNRRAELGYGAVEIDFVNDTWSFVLGVDLDVLSLVGVRAPWARPLRQAAASR